MSTRREKKSLSRTLRRWAVALRKATHGALNHMDEGSHGDDRINTLFHGEAGKLTEAAGMDRDSGASSTPVCMSEMRLTTETEESEHSTQNDRSSRDGEDADGEEEIEDDEISESFLRFDAVAECERLRKQSPGPFCKGDEIWEHRRALWLKPTVSRTKIQESEERREVFAKIPQNYYTRIYKRLVMDNKPLREPMNLQDAIQIINAGWIETRKWEDAANGLA